MISTFFRPEMRRGNVENINNNPLSIRFAVKTSDIRNFPENIRSGNTGTMQRMDVRCPSVSIFLRDVCLRNRSRKIPCYSVNKAKIKSMTRLKSLFSQNDSIRGTINDLRLESESFLQNF